MTKTRGRMDITRRALEDFFLPEGYQIVDVWIDRATRGCGVNLTIEGPNLYEVTEGALIPQMTVELEESGPPCEKCGWRECNKKIVTL